jgi:hypothetical protein
MRRWVRANRFGIVTSGTKFSVGPELDRVRPAVERIPAEGEVCLPARASESCRSGP